MRRESAGICKICRSERNRGQSERGKLPSLPAPLNTLPRPPQKGIFRDLAKTNNQHKLPRAGNFLYADGEITEMDMKKMKDIIINIERVCDNGQDLAREAMGKEPGQRRQNNYWRYVRQYLKDLKDVMDAEETN